MTIKLIISIILLYILSSCGAILQRQATKNYKDPICKTKAYKTLNSKQQDFLYLKTICEKYFPNINEYFPENERLTFKVLCDTKGKLLGAQAIGNGAAARINIISLAIEHGLTIDDILPFEMAYCPAVSEVNDILFKACEFAKRRIK